MKYVYLISDRILTGGWNEGSVKYSAMAGNAKNRQVFAQSALDLILQYNFDGLDLDWEFPADRGGSSDDRRHFTILVQVSYLLCKRQFLSKLIQCFVINFAGASPQI